MNESIATVDVACLAALVDAGYLTCRQHPTAALLIWNYTPRAQFEHFWTPEILMCRGLITTREGQIVARPFKKFFNLEEHLAGGGSLPDGPFRVYEKLDGSLGVSYWLTGDALPYLATRGSFTSEQALRGTAILRRRYGSVAFDPAYTYLFEILYPENRIVVDYAGREDVVLLAKIHIATGAEVDLDDDDRWATPTATRVRGLSTIEQVAQHIDRADGSNREGYVLHWPQHGLRLKVKFAEYVRLHRLLTGITARTIWEWLRAGDDVAAVLDRVPDEFYAWVRATEATLRGEYARIEGYCLEIAERVRALATRKEQAEVVKTTRYPGVVFKMLDGKPYDDAIWRQVKPAAEQPFHPESEATA